MDEQNLRKTLQLFYAGVIVEAVSNFHHFGVLDQVIEKKQADPGLRYGQEARRPAALVIFAASIPSEDSPQPSSRVTPWRSTKPCGRESAAASGFPRRETSGLRWRPAPRRPRTGSAR